MFEGTSPSEPTVPGECSGPDHGILRWDEAQLLLVTLTGFTDRLRTTAALPDLLRPARTHCFMYLDIHMHAF